MKYLCHISMPTIPTNKRRYWQGEPSTRHYKAPWYNTRAWQKRRQEYLNEQPNNRLCQECLKQGKIKAIGVTKGDWVLDHIKRVGSYPEQQREQAFWDYNNQQGLCKPCHDIKSAKEKNG